MFPGPNETCMVVQKGQAGADLTVPTQYDFSLFSKGAVSVGVSQDTFDGDSFSHPLQFSHQLCLPGLPGSYPS